MMTDLNVYELDRKETVIFYSAAGILAILVAELMYRNIIFAAVLIPFTGRVKKYVTEILKERRRRQYLLEFKDELFVISTSIGAGRSMKDAIAESIPALDSIYGRKSVLVGELKKAYERMNVGGENDIDVLLDMATASGLEDCIDFVTVYSICKKTGASLILALNKAASVIMDKMTIEREISELVRRKESEGLIIFIMPITVILFLNLCAPDYIAPLYQTIAGRVIMTAVVTANIGIYGMIRKIVEVKI